MQGESRAGEKRGLPRVRTHLYPMLPVASGMILGIVAVLPMAVPDSGLSPLLTATLVALSAYLVSDRGTRQRLCFGLAAGMMLMIIHVRAPWQTYRQRLGTHAGGEITAVVTDPFADPGPWEIKTRTQRLTVRLRSVRLTGEQRSRPCRGKVELVVRADVHVNYGDTISASGAFLTPNSPSIRGQFNYRNHLLSRGIRHQFWAESISLHKGSPGRTAAMRALFRIREWLADRLVAGFREEKNARSAAAMVLGYRRALDAATRRVFLRSGALHIFAISGLHVGIAMLVAATCMKGLRVPYRSRYVALPFLLGIYVLLTGGAASAIRAWIMLSTLCIATARLRPPSPINSLSLAAVVILGCNPLSLLNTGFQFSFVIVTALVLGWRMVGNILRIESERQAWLPPGIRRGGRIRRWSYHVVRSLACGALAWLGSAGIVAWVNCLLIPAAIWVNIVVAMLATTALSCAVAKLLVGCLGLSFANVALATPLECSLIAVRALVETAAAGGGCMAISRPWLPLVFVYYALFAVVLAPVSTGRARRRAGGGMILILCLFALGGRIHRDRVTFVHGNGMGNVSVVIEQQGVPPVAAFSGDYLVDLATLDLLRGKGYDRLQAAVFAGAGNAGDQSMTNVVPRVAAERVVASRKSEEEWQKMFTGTHAKPPNFSQVTTSGNVVNGSERLPPWLTLTALKRGIKEITIDQGRRDQVTVTIHRAQSTSAVVATRWQQSQAVTESLPACREIRTLVHLRPTQ